MYITGIREPGHPGVNSSPPWGDLGAKMASVVEVYMINLSNGFLGDPGDPQGISRTSLGSPGASPGRPHVVPGWSQALPWGPQGSSEGPQEVPRPGGFPSFFVRSLGSISWAHSNVFSSLKTQQKLSNS